MSMSCKQNGTPALTWSTLRGVQVWVPFWSLASRLFDPRQRQVLFARALVLWACLLLPITGVAATLLGEYHFEESQWTGAANEVIDTSGNNRHG